MAHFGACNIISCYWMHCCWLAAAVAGNGGGWAATVDYRCPVCRLMQVMLDVDMRPMGSRGVLWDRL